MLLRVHYFFLWEDAKFHWMCLFCTGVRQREEEIHELVTKLNRILWHNIDNKVNKREELKNLQFRNFYITSNTNSFNRDSKTFIIRNVKFKLRILK